MAQLMPLPLTVSCFSKIQIGFTFLVLVHTGSPRKRAVKWVCVCYGLLHVDHSYTVLHSVACCAELAVERLTLNSYRLHLRSAQSRSRLTDSSCVGIPLTRHLAGHKMFSPSVCTCDSSSLSPTLLHPFNGPFSGTTQVSRYQKGKTNLDFTEARDSEWQWHLLGHMQVCTLL